MRIIICLPQCVCVASLEVSAQLKVCRTNLSGVLYNLLPVVVTLESPQQGQHILTGISFAGTFQIFHLWQLVNTNESEVLGAEGASLISPR